VSATDRNLAIATAANTLGITAHATYMYYLAPIALRTVGIHDKDAVIFSLIAIAMGSTVVPAGKLADKIPRRYCMRLGLALLGLAYVAFFLPLGLFAMAAGTASSGVGLALLFVSFQSYVADLLRVEERTGAYARAGALAVLATAIGPFLAAIVFRTTTDGVAGLRWNALLFGFSSFAGIALTMLLPSVRQEPPSPAERGRWTEAARAAGPIALLYVLMGAGYGMTAPYFTVYFLDHVGFANEAWGYVLAMGTFMSALGAILAGKLGRYLSAPPIALLGMSGLVLSSLVFLFPVPTFAFVLGFLGRSLFSTTVGPGMNTLLMSRSSTGRRAEAQAYGSLAWNVGWAAGGAVGGISLVTLGGASFMVGGALAFVGVVLGALLLHERRRQGASPR
jgi:predicted MFS family arabinose efflux permease